jgi:malate synthase
VLIETLPAAFEMDEILHELGEHAAGLNCGRWDYIFSFIKARRHDPAAVMPDRSQVTMEQPCMRAYTLLSIRTCHRRGAHAMDGRDPHSERPGGCVSGRRKVRADKRREVETPRWTWRIRRFAGASFEAEWAEAESTIGCEDISVTADGSGSSKGTHRGGPHDVDRISTGAWLRGRVHPLYHLEDAATAEISGTGLAWITAPQQDGRPVTAALFQKSWEGDGDDRQVGYRYETGCYRRRNLFVQL